MLNVKNREATYARDAVTFDEVVYLFPVLAGLLRVRSTAGNRLSVSDFGASLGTTIAATRNGPLCALETLAQCAYERFAWFHNHWNI